MIYPRFIEMWIQGKITDVLREDYAQDIPRFNNEPSHPAKLKIEFYRDLLHFFQNIYDFSPDFEGDKEKRMYEFCQWFIKEHDLIERQSKPQRTVSRYEIMEIR